VDRTCLLGSLKHDGGQRLLVFCDSFKRMSAFLRRPLRVGDGVVENTTKVSASRLHVATLVIVVVPVSEAQSFKLLNVYTTVLYTL